MLRILIVDDEQIVLQGIRMMIERKMRLSFPIDIVTASNVPKALNLLQDFKADLVLTDIRMPVVDGFELIERIREQKCKAGVIILTSYADFEYAQKAIRYGVIDFILKPIQQEALQKTLEQVWQMKKEGEESRQDSILLEIRNMMLYDLPYQELIGDVELIRQLFPYEYFTVVVLSSEELSFSLMEYLPAVFQEYFDVCKFFYLQERRQLIAICNHFRYKTETGALEAKLAEQISASSLYVGISISSSSYKVLHDLYVNATQRIFYVKHLGDRENMVEVSLFSYQDCVNIYEEKSTRNMEIMIRNYLRKVSAIFGEVDLEMVYDSFFANIKLYLESYFIWELVGLEHETLRELDEDKLVEVMICQLQVIKQNVRKYTDSQEKDDLSQRLIAYIKKHCRENITLDDLAEYVGFHPNYVCGLFKRRVGCSYLTCLHKERIQEAKRLLRETDNTIEQVAADVGYTNAAQLARNFRKYEGITPSEYRKFMTMASHI